MPRPSFGTRLRIASKAVTGLFSDKSATEAYGLLQGLYPSAVGPMPERGTQQILEGYSKMPWLRAVTQRIGEAVASVQWQVLAPTSQAPDQAAMIRRSLAAVRGLERAALQKTMIDQRQLRVIEQHPLLDALRTANEFLVGHALIHLTQVHLDMVGESFWIKERNGLGAPVGFWPIPPHWVKFTPTPSRRSYWVQWAAWQGDIPDTEVVWFKHVDPANPYGRGSGIARALGDELETDEFAARHTRMTFLNRARPDMIIWPEEGKHDAGTITKETAERLAEKWRAEHQGFWRAALPYFATRKLGVHEFGNNFQELQLIELRKHERDVITQTFGMPPEELGITESSNRATATVSEFIFKKNLVVPRLEFLRQNIQERLMPEYDERLLIGYVNPVEEDKQVQQQMATANAGSLMVDEWRGLQGFPPLPDGKGQVFLVPTLVKPIADLTAVPDIPLAVPTAVPPPLQRAAEEWRRYHAACKDAGDAETCAIIEKELGDDPSGLPELSRRVSSREPAFRRTVAASLTALREQTPLQALEAACRLSGRESVASHVLAAVPLAAWGADLKAEAQETFHDAYMVGATVGASAAGLRLERSAAVRKDGGFSFNVANQLAVDWAKQQSSQLIVGASDATISAVQAAVGRALELGWGAEETARTIRASIGLTERQAGAVTNFIARLAKQDENADRPMTDEKFWARVDRYATAQVNARALVIARTELAASASAGQQGLWDAATKDGVLDADSLVKIWLVASDEALCDECEGLGEDDGVPIDEPFSNGDMGPPAHPNCRCATGLERADDTEGAMLRRGVNAARKGSDADVAVVVADAVRAGFASLAAAISDADKRN